MPRIRVLVVDDSPAMRKSLVFALQRVGDLHYFEAQDGAEAIARLARESVDLVITDINMPVLDGLKLISHIRRGPSDRQPAIVVISTESADADRSRALSLGANAYLVKPVQSRQVTEAVRGVLGLGPVGLDSDGGGR